MVHLDPAECFRDSPHFRAEIEVIEQNTDRYAEALKGIAQLSKKAAEAERAALAINLQLAEEIANIATLEGNVVYETESNLVSSFHRVSQVLKQVHSHREQLVVALENSIPQSVNKFLQNEVTLIKQSRTKFDSDFQEYESELLKFCAASKKKEARGNTEDLQTTINALRASRKSFHSSSLSFCNLLNEISAVKKIHFLESLVSYMHSLSSYTGKTQKLMEDFEPSLKDLTVSLQETKGAILSEKKSEQSKTSWYLDEGVQQFAKSLHPPSSSFLNLKRDGSVSSTSSASTSTSGTSKQEEERAAADTSVKLPLVPMEGYLLKRSSGARKTWSRRYFILNLSECRLDYISPKDSDTPIVAMHLANTTVRESDSDDRRYVMNVSSPSESYYLQAETEGDFIDWKNALLAASQHGPMDISDKASMMSISASSNFQTSTSTFSLRTSSSKASIDVLDEQVGEDRNALLKTGELYYKKGAKKTLTRTLTKSSTQSDFTSTAADWKRVFTSLSKDNRLVLFEYDKETRTVSKKAMVSKVVASIDLSTLENHAIRATHDSVTGRKHSMSIQTKERTIYLAADTARERDDWVLTCNRHLLDKKHDPSKLRIAVTLSAEVHEARGIPSGDVYAEIKVDELLLATTSIKSKTSTPYWGESFHIDDIREIDVGVLVSVKYQSTSRLQKDNTFGHCLIPAEQLLIHGQAEGWFPLIKGPFMGKPSSSADKSTEKSDGQRPELKAYILYQSIEVMPLENYQPLSELLDDMDADSMFEISKLSTHLEGMSQNFLRIFLGKGTVVSWLQKVVGAEIMRTDNANVMFRANSLATKALDQYMKVVGLEYLEKTIGEVVRAICDSKQSCEVDPTRLAKGEDVAQNWQRLIGFVTQVWSSISKSAADMPKEFRAIFANIQKVAIEKFGADDSRSSVRYTTVSGFLFLRFFCPAVLTPKLFGLLSEHPDERTRRTLTLITKTLQCLANLGNFSVKEEFMQPMNEFLMDHTSTMMDFIDEAASFKGEIAQQIYPVDLEREFAELQHFVNSKQDRLEALKGAHLKKLIQVVGVLEKKLDSMSKVSLGTFLKMAK